MEKEGNKERIEGKKKEKLTDKIRNQETREWMIEGKKKETREKREPMN